MAEASDSSKRFCYQYPRPAVTVDLVLFSYEEQRLRVLLIQRDRAPFEGCWAIPGGFLDLEELPEAGARRELVEETGVQTPWGLHSIGFFAKPGRDPRGRTISLAFAAAISPPAPAAKGGDDARKARWVGLDEVVPLAFDHDQILAAGVAWLRMAIEGGTAAVELLPERFTRDEAYGLRAQVGADPRGGAAWLRGLRERGLVERLTPRGQVYERRLSVP